MVELGNRASLLADRLLAGGVVRIVSSDLDGVALARSNWRVCHFRRAAGTPIPWGISLLLERVYVEPVRCDRLLLAWFRDSLSQEEIGATDSGMGRPMELFLVPDASGRAGIRLHAGVASPDGPLWWRDLALDWVLSAGGVFILSCG